jgi:Fur family ferric uptake transcriptional regulator
MGEPSTELVERFRRWLRDRRQPLTRQRDLVAGVIFASDQHLSADDVARVLRSRGEAVGTATIYRTLDTLVEAGFARAHDFGEGFRRYEPLEAGTPHGHLVCSRCGVVLEFKLDRLGRALPLLADEFDFLAERYRVEVHGTCRGCRRNDIGALARAGSKR